MIKGYNKNSSIPLTHNTITVPAWETKLLKYLA
jgi:hypothetical protein